MPTAPDSRSTDRAQTALDFVIGIGIFILAVAFVFTTVPSFVTPHQSVVGSAETAQAERIADRIVAETGTSGNELSRSQFESTYADGDLVEELALRSSDGVVFDNVNISVETVDGEAVDTATLAAGDQYDGQPAASAVRLVTVTELTPHGACEPACRLVVRVW